MSGGQVKLVVCAVILPLVPMHLQPRSEGCSCATFPTAESMMAEDGPVFMAEVTSVTRVGLSRQYINLRVLRSWRGVTGTQLGAVSGGGGADCGIAPTPGTVLLTVGFDGEEGLSLWTCSTLMDAEQVNETAAELDALAEPLDLNDGPDPLWPPYDSVTDSTCACPPFCGLGMMPLATAFGLYFVRRQRGCRGG